MRLAAVLAALLQGPPGADTLPPRRLDPVVVTADRAGASLSSSVSAVTRLAAVELARLPRATLADVLRMVPGFTLVDFDGLGFDPQLMVRGFYGGGEAEYVVVQIDGRPVNQLHTGLVAWDVLPSLAAIEAIEVVRGGASSLYGDAAIGGVINVLTRARAMAPSSRLRWSAGGGSFGSFRASGAWEGPAGGRDFNLAAAGDRIAGFRRHAERTALRSRAGLTLVDAADRQLRLAVQSHWREFEEPGPLLESLLAQERNGSDPLFRFDRSTDRDGAILLDGFRRLGGKTQLGGALSGELRRVDATRTLALAPGFGDTKARRAATRRVALSLQVDQGEALLPGKDRVVIGVEASRGGLDSRYYRVAGGTRDDYAAATGAREALDTRGESVRSAAAWYAQYTVQPIPALRLSLGARYDRLHDSFEPASPAGQSPRAANHSALSPKAGANLRYLEGAGSTGNLYVSVSRSFKAPTLDQLYDQRNIPVPFPPFAIQTSNPALHPQRGTSLEAGLYHSTALLPSLRATASLSAYQTEMTDELDFDIETFRYVNLGKSRHRGVEAGVNLEGTRVAGFANYTLQAATARSGGNAGKRLKAIPRHSLNAGVSVRPRRILEASLFATRVRAVYLDDANSVSLPDYTRLDGQLSVRTAGVTLYLDARNLTGKRYSSSGFLDPSGSGEAYFYPAAGRVLELGVRSGW